MSKFIIEVRTKGFGKAETELKRVGDQTRSFARRANKGADAGATFRREVSQLRNNMLLYTFAIGGAVAGMGKFIKVASDAREQASQFKIVFGEFAGEADAFASSIQNSFGIAKSEMVKLLAGLQDTFVPLGFSREEASKLSMSIAQLSLDVGSFKNIATGDVAQRFTSALIGNHEAVRSLGISLTEARIKQEALKLGIIGVNDEMTQEAKILGRMSLIFKGTADAQGNLTLTQEEFANRLRGTSGRLNQLQEEIGNALIPMGHFGLSLVDFMSNSRRATHVLIGVSAAMAAYAASAIKAAIATNTLSVAMRRNLIFGGITLGVIAIDAFLEKLGFFGDNMQESAKQADTLGDIVKKMADSQLDLSDGTNQAAAAMAAQAEAAQESADAINKSETALAVRLAVMLEDTELGKARVAALLGENRILTEKEQKILAEIDAINAKNAAEKIAVQLAKDKAAADEASNKRMADMANATAAINQEAILIQAELDGANDLTLEKMQIVEQGARELASAMKLPYKDVIGQVQSFTEELSMENLELDLSNDTHRALAEAIINVTNQKLALAEANDTAAQATQSATDKLKKQNEELRDSQQAAQAAAGALNGVAGAIRILKAESDDPKQKLQGLIQLLAGIVSVANPVAGAGLNIFGAAIAHTGGLIKNNGIQRFATGGMVQGQDNVPILAQAGEFVMQRSAVQNIGVENLAAMNSGQSTGGVTVNIQGNMIGNDEFVRDNLLPQIRKAAQQDLA